MKCPYCTAEVLKVRNINCKEDENNIAVCNVYQDNMLGILESEVYDADVSMFQCVANPKHVFYCDDFKGNSTKNCDENLKCSWDDLEDWKNKFYDEMTEIGVEKFVETHPEIWYIKKECSCGVSIGSFSIDAGKKGICSNCNSIFQFPIDSIATQNLSVASDKKQTYKINDHRKELL